MDTDNYNDAIAHRDHLRNIQPAQYNENRLLECPIPNIEIENGNQEEENHEIQFENIIEEEAVDMDNNDNVAEDVAQNENEQVRMIQQIFVPNENEVQNDTDISNEIKIEDPIQIGEADQIELDHILDNTEDGYDSIEEGFEHNSSSDSVEIVDTLGSSNGFPKPMHFSDRNDSVKQENERRVENNSSLDVVEIIETSIGSKGFPKPLASINVDALTKQENDSISGDLPFSLRVSFFFF